jgi:hypothetical protein
MRASQLGRGQPRLAAAAALANSGALSIETSQYTSQCIISGLLVY